MQTVTGDKVHAVGDAVLDEKTLIDNNADGNKYVGIATGGTATTEEAWTITRITSTNPQEISNAPKNSIWNSRTGLVYS